MYIICCKMYIIWQNVREINVFYTKKLFVFHCRIIAELAIFIAESGYFALQNRPKNIAEFRGVWDVLTVTHSSVAERVLSVE